MLIKGTVKLFFDFSEKDTSITNKKRDVEKQLHISFKEVPANIIFLYCGNSLFRKHNSGLCVIYNIGTYNIQVIQEVGLELANKNFCFIDNLHIGLFTKLCIKLPSNRSRERKISYF